MKEKVGAGDRPATCLYPESISWTTASAHITPADSKSPSTVFFFAFFRFWISRCLPTHPVFHNSGAEGAI